MFLISSIYSIILYKDWDHICKKQKNDKKRYKNKQTKMQQQKPKTKILITVVISKL